MGIEDAGSLPTKKTKGIIDMWSTNVVLHGKSGVGKTAMLAEFDNIFFIRTEDRHDHVDIFEKRVKNWGQFKKVVSALTKKCPYRTIAVDTLKNLYYWCQEYVCKKLEIEHESDLKYGKGWNAVRLEFARYITKLANVNAGVWFVAHTQMITVENSLYKGDTFAVNLPTQPYDIVVPICNMTLFMGFDPDAEDEGGGAKRIMVCQPIDDIEAKDSYGVLPDIIKLGNNPKTAFKRMLKHFKSSAKKEK